MSQYRYFFNGEEITGKSFIDDNLVAHVPEWVLSATDEELEAVGVTKELFVPETAPEPTEEELIAQATEAISGALNAAIKDKYVEIQQETGHDFKDPVEFKTFAGFPNVFQSVAQQFGAWEAEVWHQANLYKQQVLLGEVVMPSIEEAVAMMPSYPLI